MDATTNSTLHKPSFFTWARAGGMLFGFGNQLLFAITVWYLFWFLRDGSLNTQHSHWVEIDLLLAVIFAVSHSLLLAPFMRKRLKSLIPSAFYESFFSATTCFCFASGAPANTVYGTCKMDHYLQSASFSMPLGLLCSIR